MQHICITRPVSLFAVGSIFVLAVLALGPSPLSSSSSSVGADRTLSDGDERPGSEPLPASGEGANVQSCPGDLSGPNGTPDGTVDVFDLIELINLWGPCANPADCPADLSGPNGDPDGVVDVFDLIELINRWGPCATGACCLNDGQCEQRKAVDCLGSGETFHGEGADCNDVICAQFECPAGAIDENERCGASTNDGCNVDPPMLGPTLSCGDTVCGTAWADGGNRDTDWFPIQIAVPTKITFTVEPEFAAQVFIVNEHCGDNLHIHDSAVGADEVSASACLPPGNYRLVVATDGTDGYPCGTTNDYVASVSCEACVPPGQSCDNAIPVAVNGGIVTTSTVGRDVASDLPDCIGFGQGIPQTPTVWFAVEGTGTMLTATTCGPSSLATPVSVLCGLCETLTCVAADNDTNIECDTNPFASQTTFCSELGHTYYIAVWSQGTPSAGPVSLEVTSDGSFCTPQVECPTSGMCEGFCGAQAPEGCWCDDFVCQMFPEACCPGVCQDCPALEQCNGAGSCAGVPCGQQSPDGCWCDEQCGGMDDCCDDVCDECPGLQQCLDCPEVDCQDNVGEPCGDNINGGCNSSPPAFSPISCGQTKCGNLWATGGQRDLDWFELTITEPRVVTWSVEAEATVNAFITNGECGLSQQTLALDSGCSPTVSICLPAGTYHLVVGPTDFHGSPCPGFTYQATVTCQEDPNCIGGTCAGLCGGGWPIGCEFPDCICWCDEECHMLGDCCDDVCDECPQLPDCN